MKKQILICIGIITICLSLFNGISIATNQHEGQSLTNYIKIASADTEAGSRLWCAEPVFVGVTTIRECSTCQLHFNCWIWKNESTC